MQSGRLFGMLSELTKRLRISTELFMLTAVIAVVVIAGLAVVALQLSIVQQRIHQLRDQSLPRLIKLSQLSQESAASIAIAPAMSTNPTRFEFETLLSRLHDKRVSQDVLIGELRALIEDEKATEKLQINSQLLADNQSSLTDVVRQQIDVRKRLEKHVEKLQAMERALDRLSYLDSVSRLQVELTRTAVVRLANGLLDPVRARFSRNRRGIDSRIELVRQAVADIPPSDRDDHPAAAFIAYWDLQSDQIYQDKELALTNAFRIKALVEENSLIANRLLASAVTEFTRASEELTEQIHRIGEINRFNLAAMAITFVAFGAGALLFLNLLRKRVFHRLEYIRQALHRYAQDRSNVLGDDRRDEIGEIQQAMQDYMEVIDGHEKALAEKTREMEKLSRQLSKYLSPQVYDSIFSGQRQVQLTSERKKLTVFFSDIVGFTEMADRMESEDLTKLLNQYLTEMSQIALSHGATIDKFIGDAIMVFFGDPTSRGVREDAISCVEMALAMQRRLGQLVQEWRDAGIVTQFSCRIGIHTGYCTVGNFGSEDRMDYTIIGGTVNMASRLESIAETGQILISFETYALVKEKIHCEAGAEVEVKGIAYPVATYRVTGAIEGASGRPERLSKSRPGLELSMDVGSMSSSDRKATREVLQQGLRILDSDESG